MNKNQKKVLIQIILSSIILIISLVLSNLFKDNDFIKYLSIVLYFLSYFIIGYKVLIKSFKNICHGKIFDELFLMSIATIGAFILQEFFEGVAVMLFYQIGELFQDLAVSSSRKSITSLIEIVPKKAIRINNGIEEEIDADEVRIDDILLIKVGEKIPVDSIIIEGDTTLDTSSLTGESLPVEKYKGDEVLSGTINVSNVIKVKATKTFEKSAIYSVLSLIEDASSSKGKTESFITKFAKYYTPIVVISAVIISIIPPLFDNYDFKKYVIKGLSFLVISCPCALVISVPLSFFSGIGKASKNGILIKGSNHIEKLSSVNCILLDKTGTITTGVFEVDEINNINNNKLFNKLFYSIENKSTHPLAKAIVKYYKNENELTLEDIKEIPGKGVIANYNNKLVLCGNESLLNKYNVITNKVDGTIIHLAYDNNYLGYIKLSDKIKNDSKAAITKLKKANIKEVVMLTGDKESASCLVANNVGVTAYKSELLPNEKLEVIKEYKDNKYVTCFIGDGINDAPSLAIADVSISMGSGSTLAIETSDVVIINNSLENVYKAINISKSTMHTAYFNIVFSIVIKLLILLISIFFDTNMVLAIFADVGVMVICVLNSMRNMF